jgi:hypothetical protein
LANEEEVQSPIREADELVAVFTVGVRKARQPVDSNFEVNKF